VRPEDILSMPDFEIDLDSPEEMEN